MIELIEVGNESCFKENMQLSELSKINYIFGPNGSGKTTISELLATNDTENRSSIHWLHNETKTIKVYNYHSARTTFTKTDGEEPGVFLLGDDSKEKRDKIEKLEKEQKKITKKIQDLDKNLDETKKELNNRQEELAETIWKRRDLIPNILYENMQGIKRSKIQCMNKALEAWVNNGNNAVDDNFSDLESIAQDAFNKSTEEHSHIPSPPEINWNEEELKEILQHPIINTSNSQFTILVNQLSNSDWVHEGLNYFHNDNNEEQLCPFCQQNISENLAEKISQLFNETYEAQLCEVKRFQQQLDTAKQEFRKYQSNVITLLQGLENGNDIENKINTLERLIDNVIVAIQEKLNSPSKNIIITLVNAEYESLKATVTSINSSIDKTNQIIKNRKKTQREVIDKSWRIFACVTLMDLITDFMKEKERLDKKIDGLNLKMKDQQEYRDKASKSLSEIRSKTTSSAQTIEGMNKLLQLAGFHSFHFAPSKTIKDGYRIVRDNDQTVNIDTLSEGERTFVTFLYFYHSLSAIPQGNESEKIVAVVDDPISSLDGDIMFIVSSLVRGLIEKVKDESHNRVEQVLLFTHNTRFHNEICYQHKGKSEKKIKFYRIRKDAPKASTIEDCGCTNMIRSNYQELWDEVALAASKPDVPAPWLPNVLRRILESYFSTLGGFTNLYKIGEHLSEEEYILHRALIAWVHSGSHTVIDSDDYVQPDFSNKRWLEAFERVFKGNSGVHAEHYKMMMQEAQNHLKASSEETNRQ